MPGTSDPIVAYLVHRGVLVGIMVMVVISFGYLLFRWTPEIVDWVTSSIQTVQDAFTWELF
ncbi:MAG: hypothetical protein ACT4NY_27250 [Pseudonocardiales bacterium]